MDWRKFIAPSLFAVAIISGLGYIRARGSSPPPDPNDPKDVGQMDSTVLQRNLKWASDFINERRALKEVSDAEGRDMVANYAEMLTAHIDVGRVDGREAWKYGDIMRTARQWDKAEALLTQAVEHAKKHKVEDRRVNDSLRLAHVKAHMGQIDEAILLVQSVFDASPANKAPILLATYLEVIPAARDKGRDVALGQLLEEAITQHVQTKVDPDSPAGHAFIAARGHHLSEAWNLVLELYRSGRREDLARQVPAKMKRSTDQALNPSEMR